MATSTQPESVGDKYEVVSNIGRGSFGNIFKVRRKSDGKILCRKDVNYLKMSNKEREQLQTEVNILSQLRHPNIVSYYHRDHIKEQHELHLYMEYCGGGDLSKVISKLAARHELPDEAYVWNITSQLLSALYRCHNGEDPPSVPDNVMSAPKGHKLRTKNQWIVLHRDLKPENVFLGEDDRVKLGDFGLSKSIQGADFASTYVGTPYYMSPEICAGESYSSKSDIWSMGCIVYELCTSRPPFDAKTHIELIQKIRQGAYKPMPSVYSPELQNLVASCLKINPQKRPTVVDMLDNPIVRLMRKEREVAEMGRALKLKEAETESMRKEAEALLKTFEKDKQSLENEKQVARDEINAALHREWEVKAHLEIQRQVQLERQNMSKKWDEEFPKHVQAAVQEKMQELYAAQAAQQQLKHEQAQRSTSPETVPTSSVHTNRTVDDFTTDLSSLSMMDSPFKDSMKRNSRTPYTRDKSRTQFDSPMDVQMASPSPAAINTLSLSPRRNGGAGNRLNAPTTQNLFTAANNGHRWQPTNMSPGLSDDDHAFEGDHSDDEDIGDLPSPTLARGNNDPFKAARPRVGRPGLGRQQTMPVARAGQQAGVSDIFNINRDQPPKRSTSPIRERRTGFKTARTEADMLHKDVVKRNAGRTLVELQQDQVQNRAIAAQEDLVLPPKTEDAGNENAMVGVKVTDHQAIPDYYKEVAVWNPETCDEMPSPFLVKKRRGILPVR